MDILNELCSFRAVFDIKLYQLTAQFDSPICAVETALFTTQSDIVALANRVTVAEDCFLKFLSVPAAPHALPSASASSNISCHSAHAEGSPVSVTSMTVVLHEIQQRDTKKNNVIISGLLAVSTSNHDFAFDLFNDLGINVSPRLVKRIRKLMHGKPQLYLLLC